jgi:hypothetical protein
MQHCTPDFSYLSAATMLRYRTEIPDAGMPMPIYAYSLKVFLLGFPFTERIPYFGMVETKAKSSWQ